MDRILYGVVAALAASLFVVPLPARSHDEGTEEFPCDEGPFGVPGLTDPPNQIGEWSAVTAWPHQATHVTILHTGKVLWWRGDSPSGIPIATYVWDPDTEQLSLQLTPSDLLCAGHATLPDGRVLVAGGTVVPNQTGIPDTNIFDPISETWTPGDPLAYARWYPTLTTLADGRVLATLGRIHIAPTVLATIPEIWDPATGLWSELPGAEMVDLELYPQLYPLMFQLPDGRVLYPSTSGESRALTVATETWETINTSNFALREGSAAAYEPGKILRVGGGVIGNADVGTASVETLDMTQPSPTWQVASEMSYPRHRPDLVILPDGRLLAVGGSIEGDSSPECAMHTAEVFDPATNLWTTWASMARPRIYHSTAALLPDGRVLAAGGENSHLLEGETNYEIFSPPYLFQGTRPQIATAPASVDYGASFEVVTPDAAAIAKVAFMRPASVTHNFDENQRYVPLSFTQAVGSLSVSAPADGGTAPPGYYMLFLVDSSGVPSEAKFIALPEPTQTLQLAAGFLALAMLGRHRLRPRRS